MTATEINGADESCFTDLYSYLAALVTIKLHITISCNETTIVSFAGYDIITLGMPSTALREYLIFFTDGSNVLPSA